MVEKNAMKTYVITTHSKHRQRGETLIEAMVAIFVLSFGVLVLMLAQLGSVNSVIDANNQSEVARAANNYAERLAATPTLKVVEIKDEASDNNKVYIQQTYDAVSDCTSQLGLNLNNASIQSCAVDGNGNIAIKWGAQDSDDTNGFTYKLSAGNVPLDNTTSGNTTP